MKSDTMHVKLLSKDMFIGDLKNIAEKALGPWLQNNKNGVNFASVIMLSMNVVEIYSSTVATVSSKDKLQAAEDMIPIIVDLCVEQNILSKEDGESLKAKLAIAGDIIVNIIEAYITISKNPAFIQAKEEIEAEVKKCWAHCKKH